MQRRKFLLTGPSGAGKSSLCAALFAQGQVVHKTQSPEYHGVVAVDLPGEYVTHPQCRMAFLACVEEVDALLVVLPATMREPAFSGGILHVMPWTRLVGVISKRDLPDADSARVRRYCALLGLHEPIFETSLKHPQTIVTLRTWLQEQGLFPT